MLPFLLLACIFVATICYLAYSFYRDTKKLPPGPFPLPFIGNLGTTLHPPRLNRDLMNLAKRFGSVFTVRMPFPVVNIADFEALKDANRGDDIIGRISNIVVDMMLHEKNGGLVFSEGDNWREQRRVAISILRDFGMGRNMMEEKVTHSVLEFLEHLKTKDDVELERIDLRWSLQCFVANVINEILFGYSYKYNDCDRLMGFVLAFNKFSEDVAESKAMHACMLMPWLRHVPIIKEYAYGRHERNWKKLIDFIVVETDRSLADYHSEQDDSGESTCFVHEYVKRGKGNPMMSTGQLRSSCSDLFLAGQETTTTTLRWAVLFLAGNQDVQDKLRTEIESVVGSSRIARMADKAKMPYTQATIHEIQRRANILPITFPIMRKATVNTEIDGMKVPKGTMVNPDLYAIHYTDPHFVEPMKFMPERYLHDDGKTLRKELVERTIPFGMGKRLCAGEGLARVELFIGLTALIQNYRILPPLDGPIDIEPHYFNVLLPKDQKVHLERISH